MVERAKSLTTQVFEELLRDIVQGRRASGSLLSEKAVAQQFGTSKTPVREAFVQLQSLGLVQVLPQRGCMVFTPSVEEVRALCEARLIIEGAAIRLSVERGREALTSDLRRCFERMETRVRRARGTTFGEEDALFHRAFLDHAGNGALREAHGLLAPRLQALRTNLQSLAGYLLTQAQEDHAAIIEAVERADPDAALAALEVHVARMTRSYETERDLLPAAQ